MLADKYATFSHYIVIQSELIQIKRKISIYLFIIYENK